MTLFQSRLFLRIITKSREVYVLKIITLAVAFACSALVTIFSFSEFAYDRFHQDYNSVFRMLRRNNNESYSGNRLSCRIPLQIYSRLYKENADSVIIARVKILNDLNVHIDGKLIHQQKLYAADAGLTKILSFHVINGSLQEFQQSENTALLSSTYAIQYFGTTQAAGKPFKLSAFGDSVVYTVAAVYEDYPPNSHEEFKGVIRFDDKSIQALNFDEFDFNVYGKALLGNLSNYEAFVNSRFPSESITYRIQPISEIYFGARVLGEDARHGDQYSIILLISITGLILFLAIAGFINLTTLSLPYRAKELAVKKLTGTSQQSLVFTFLVESFVLVGVSLMLGVVLLALTSSWIQPILSIDLIALLLEVDAILVLILGLLFLVFSLTPLLLTFKFTQITPSRLLSGASITFPRFKRAIIFLQLGISIFLIVASIVVKRQVNYSLLKEPGRNHEQVVYLSYPNDLTNEGLRNLQQNWKKHNPNIVDVMAASQLPNQISSKELNSDFYFLSVDPGFAHFFDLKINEGNWFGPNSTDSVFVINEIGKKVAAANQLNRIGVFEDLSAQFNQPQKPIKMFTSSYPNYNFLCIKILEVDIRKTIDRLSGYFEEETHRPKISFLNKRFDEWIQYQDRLNYLSEVLAVVSLLLSCFSIYGLSISIVRDKLKQIAIHKLWGAGSLNITYLLVREFAGQLLLAILIFGPLTYLVLKELLRSFVYSTPFNWLDPLVPLGYCVFIITLLCGLQAYNLNREDLTSALKG